MTAATPVPDPRSGDTLRVAIAQMNTVVGDLDGNTARALDAVAEATRHGADVVIMPELTLCGYPPEDLVLKPGFVAANRAALEKFAAGTGRTVAVVGFADGRATTTAARRVPDSVGVDYANGVWNAVAVCAEGRVHDIYHKRHLPNYDVFDEHRQFRPGETEPSVYEIAGVPVGVTLCEDSWIPEGPVSALARAGARIVLNINGSPFRVGKQTVREDVIRQRVFEAGVPVVYGNLVGGQDELVFDGGSFVVGVGDHGGEVIARCGSFAESVDVFDVALAPERQPIERSALVAVTPAPDDDRFPRSAPWHDLLEPSEERWEALVLATRDYVVKSGFTDVCIGLSGGVDSSLTAAIATEALGADHVHGVLMPSRYSSDHSTADALKLAANLGIATHTVGIESAHRALLDMLEPALGVAVEPGDLADQNVQSRVRGVVLMALANAHGWLVLTTGNKSEAAVGYSTLYGDTAGAYAVIKDVWKLTVYELCEWRNASAGRTVVPESVLTKAPSAELRPDQRDDQSLPAYEILDPILRAYVEDDRSIADIIAAGNAAEDDVRRVCRLVDLAEYKRRQTPVGPRITGKAFGRDRRIPIINHYRG